MTKSTRSYNGVLNRNEEEQPKDMIIKGKAVAFNSPETYFGITEVIDPNALNECDMSDVVLRYNHNDTQWSLARTRNQSLSLELKDDGLYFEAKLNPDITDQREAYLRIQDGLIDKCSFAFSVEEDDYNSVTKTRTIKKINKMFDVAIVDFPFYNDTSVEARTCENRKEFIAKVQEIEKQEREKEKQKLINQLEREKLIKELEK